MRIIKKKKIDHEKEKDFIPVSPKLDENIDLLKEKFEDCDDVVFREFRVGLEQNQKMSIIYIDGMVDVNRLQEHILKSLMLDARMVSPDPGNVKRKIYELTKDGALSVGEIAEKENLDEGILGVLSGDTVVLIDGITEVLVISTKGWPGRGIQEPPSEAVIRGPRDGFVETFRMNTALLRRRIRDPRFKIKQMQLGRRTQTDIGIAYIDDIVDLKVLEEVEKRLDTIDIDGVLESGYVEQLIEDDWKSFFPQIQGSERPDSVAAALLEGRVAILIDNTPFVLIVPATFNSLIQSPEDYYERWWVSSFVRMVRIVAIVISFVLPASYIAIASYHPGIIPSHLAVFIAGSREGVPFPVFVEALIMELTFELLREAGIRLPSQIGATIGIVGSLIIGQAAVEAGLVSPIMVIVVALTAISTFAIPSYNLTIAFRLLRFSAMIAASFLGLYGLMLVVIIMIAHLSSLKSFGVPYLTPFASINISDLKDSIIRAPLMTLKHRPLFSSSLNRRRMNDLRVDKAGQVEKKEAPEKGESPKEAKIVQEKIELPKGLKKPKKVGKDQEEGGEDNEE